jgi:DNA-binding PucR family transcriptional regulator
MAVTLRELVLRFSSDPAWAEEMAHALTDAIHRELPQLQADEELARHTYASTESVIELFIERVRAQEPLTDVEPPAAAISFARELVRRGLPLDDLLRSYHIGHATFFDRWVADVRSELVDPSDVAQAVQDAAVSTFAFVRTLDGGLVRRWAAEREQWVRTTVAAQTETVRAVLAGEELDALAASRRLGYELGHVHTAFVVWRPESPSGSDPGIVDRGAVAVADALRGRGRLVVPLRGGLVAGWVDGGDPSAVISDRLPRSALSEIHVALGSPAGGLDGFCRSHREALDARRVARLARRRTGSVVTYAASAVAALASTDLERARQFVATELRSVAGDDDDARRLAGTLHVYLEEGLSPRRTARRLGVHENTVVNRIRTVEERLGHPVKPRVAELLVALRLVALVAPSEA